jgi:hypothetical protein
MRFLINMLHHCQQLSALFGICRLIIGYFMVHICFNIEVVFGQLCACTSQTNLQTVDCIVTKYFIRYDTIHDLGVEVLMSNIRLQSYGL